MTDWDSPNRSRAFLAAALAVAGFGVFLTWDIPAYQTARLEANVDRSLGSIDMDARPDTTDLVVAAASPKSASASDFDMAENLDDEEVRDAVAAPAAPPALALAGARGVFPGGASAGKLAGKTPGEAAAAARALSNAAPAEAFAEALQAVSGAHPAPSAGAASAHQSPNADPAAVADNRKLLLEWVGRSAWGGRSERAAKSAFQPSGTASSGRLLDAGAATRGRELDGAERIERERAVRRRASQSAKPPSLSKLLGRALRPPRAKIGLPKAKPWSRAKPAFDPKGGPLAAAAFTTAMLDELETPSQDLSSCKRKDGHWHADGAGPNGWWHDGAAWGRLQSGSWAWTEKEGGRWWAFANAEARPVVRHQKRWWLEAQGYWFLMHDGDPWGYWFIERWGQEGFEHVSGRQLLYSADERVLAVVTPGRGAIAYDAATGAPLQSWTEAELPARLAPKLPASAEALKP